MKIDKEKLIELLIEKTGMEQAEVEDQLQQLVKRIIDAAERGKALEIKEFGMFYFDESGELRFDVAKELSTEVNYKYAGMEPVELKPARESSKDDEDQEELTAKAGDMGEEDDSEGDPFGIDMDEAEAAPERKDSDEDRPELKDDEYDFDYEEGEPKEREDDPFAGLLGDASSKMEKGEPSGFEMNLLSEEAKKTAEEEKAADKAEEEEALFTGEAEEDEDLPADKKPEDEEIPVFDAKDEFSGDEPVEEDPFAGLINDEDDEFDEPEPVLADEKPAPKRPVKEKKRDPIMMVIGVILIFVLIGGAIVVIPSLFDSPDPEQAPATAPQQEMTEAEETDAQDVLLPLEPAEETAVTVEDAATETDEPAQPMYGLTGDLVDDANDGFSIVVYSLRQEDRAREQAASLAGDGYRVLVSSRTVGGETVWRVSVGQFESIPDAQQEAADLPSPYNTNNFIQRIQIN